MQGLDTVFHKLIMVHKPRGVVCMRGRRDEECSGINSSCPNIYEVLPEGWGHADLGSFGRLDKDTTGLFLMG